MSLTTYSPEIRMHRDEKPEAAVLPG